MKNKESEINKVMSDTNKQKKLEKHWIELSEKLLIFKQTVQGSVLNSKKMITLISGIDGLEDYYSKYQEINDFVNNTSSWYVKKTWKEVQILSDKIKMKIATDESSLTFQGDIQIKNLMRVFDLHNCHVKVLFKNKKSYIYNCDYLAMVGDVAYVSGKSENLQGKVIEVVDGYKKGPYLQKVEILKRNFPDNFDFQNYDENYQTLKKAKDKLDFAMDRLIQDNAASDKVRKYINDISFLVYINGIAYEKRLIDLGLVDYIKKLDEIGVLTSIKFKEIFDYSSENSLSKEIKDWLNNSSAVQRKENFELIEIQNSVTHDDILENVETIDIPYGVTSISEYSFEKCDSLTSVSLPESIITIEKGTFSLCKALVNVKLPKKLRSIGIMAFEYCLSLSSLDLPDSLEIIDQKAFSNCESLTSIDLPNSLKFLGGYTFHNCKSINNVTLPGSLENIDDFTFCGCESLTEIYIPDGIKNIGILAFSYCKSLTNIKLPENLTTLGYGAFKKCELLKNIEIPKNIDNIEHETFEDCASLEDVIFPTNLANIGKNAFKSCTSLKYVELPKDVHIVGAEAFSFCTSLISVKLPESLTSLGGSAFLKCRALESIHLPTKIDRMGTNFYGVFNLCDNIQEIKIGDDLVYNFREETDEIRSIKRNKILREYEKTAQKPLEIGDNYEGGIIFYILESKDKGFEPKTVHGLIVSEKDQIDEIEWCTYDKRLTSVGNTESGFGSGFGNTQKILAQNGINNEYAAGIASLYRGGDFSDWFLPSKEELYLLLKSRANVSVDPGIWSSTENDKNSAWSYSWNNRVHYLQDTPHKKSKRLRVRAIRSF